MKGERMAIYDVIVVGGGAAGLKAAVEARKNGALTLLLECEPYLGGALRSTIHVGFGKDASLSGVEYLEECIKEAEENSVEIKTRAFVFSIEKKKKFEVKFTSPEGLGVARAEAVVIAVGGIDKTASHLRLQGDRPSGVFTASEARYYINVLGKMPAEKCVVIGSDDEGADVVRSLSMRGADVIGVFEKEDSARCSDENYYYCLVDYNVPLYLSHEITKIEGKGRVSSVIVRTAEKGERIEKEKRIECDAVIIAEGNYPDVVLAKGAGAKIKNGMVVTDQNGSSTIDGLYVCGNCQADLSYMDYLIENAETAGLAAATYKLDPRFAYAETICGRGIAELQPAKINLNVDHSTVSCFFKANAEYTNVTLSVKIGDEVLYSQIYPRLKRLETQRLCLDLSSVKDCEKVTFTIE